MPATVRIAINVGTDTMPRLVYVLFPLSFLNGAIFTTSQIGGGGAASFPVNAYTPHILLRSVPALSTTVMFYLSLSSLCMLVG